MLMIKKILYYFQIKSKYTFFLISLNLISYIYKFITYRSLSSFVLELNDNLSFKKTFLFILIKLILFHLIESITNYFLNKIVTDSIKNIYENIFKVIKYKMSFFDKNNRNKFVKFYDYIYTIEYIYSKLLLEIPKNIIYIIYYSYTIYKFSFFSFIIINIFNCISMYLLNKLLLKQLSIEKHKIKLKERNKNYFLNSVDNIIFIKSKLKESSEINKLITYNYEFYNEYLNGQKINKIYNILNNIIIDSLTIIIYSTGSFYVLNKIIKPIDFLYLGINTGNLYSHLLNIKSTYNDYLKMKPKMKLVFDIINEKNIENINKSIHKINYIKNNNYLIEFKNVYFSYNINDKYILKNTSFKLEPNKLNFIIGDNGSGKSTIIKLLLGFYSNYYGNILINKIDIKKYSLLNIRKNIKVLFQNNFLFDNTLEYNLKYGVENKKINNLLKKMNIYEWYLDNKDNNIGLDGNKLSGGQKKKIKLINFLLNNSKVFIFDEPTNSLDKYSIDYLVNYIISSKLYKNHTIVIINHNQDFLKSIENNNIEINKIFLN